MKATPGIGGAPWVITDRTLASGFTDLWSSFPGGSDGKASASNAGDPGSYSWVGKIPWRRK